MPITFILYFPNLSLNNGTIPRNHSNIIIFLGVTCIKDTPTDMVRKTSFELRWAFNLSCLHAGNRLLKKPSRVSDLKTTITKVNFNVRYFYHLPSFDFFGLFILSSAPQIKDSSGSLPFKHTHKGYTWQ